MRISDWSSDVCSSDLFANQRGNIFNERSIARQAYVPPRLLAQIAGEPLGAPLGQVLSGLGITLPSTGTWTTVPVPTLLAADANSPGVRGISSSDNTGSPIRGVDNSFNYQILPGELDQIGRASCRERGWQDV